MALSNPERGRTFRDAARPILERDLGVRLSEEVSLPVGRPPKAHKFDLVAEDKSWILECKNLVWRENGGVPQAKITSMSEAAGVLMQCAHQPCRRALVLSRATHPRRRESLASISTEGDWANAKPPWGCYLSRGTTLVLVRSFGTLMRARARRSKGDAEEVGNNARRERRPRSVREGSARHPDRCTYAITPRLRDPRHGAPSCYHFVSLGHLRGNRG